MAEFRTTLLFGTDTPTIAGVTASLPAIVATSGSGTVNVLPEPDLLTVLTRIWNAQGASFRAVLSGYVRPSPASAYEDWEPDGDQFFTITNLEDAPASEAPLNQYETERGHGATPATFNTVPASSPAPFSNGSVAIKVGRAKMYDPLEDPYDETKWVWVDIYIRISPTISLTLYPSLREEGYLCEVSISITGEEYAATDYYLPITPEFPEEGLQWWAASATATWRNTFSGTFTDYDRRVAATFAGPPAAGTSDIAGGDSLGTVDVIEQNSDFSGDQGPRIHFSSIGCAITAAYGARTPTTA